MYGRTPENDSSEILTQGLMFPENYPPSLRRRQPPLGRPDHPFAEVRQQLGRGLVPHDRQNPRVRGQAGVHGLNLAKVRFLAT